MSSRNPSATSFDDISPLSKNRKLAYIGVIALALLCAPLPSGLCHSFYRNSTLAPSETTVTFVLGPEFLKCNP